MADDVGIETAERVPELPRFDDVQALELGGGGDILLQTRREVVDHEHRSAVREERVGDVRADEAGTSGDHDASRVAGHVRNTARRTGVPRMEEIKSR